MPRIKKETFRQNLATYRVLIDDTSPTSEYFKITELNGVLTGGKNAFLIEGTPFLNPTTQVLVEIISAAGDVIYSEPIRNFVEGMSRLVVVEVYEDTPPGPARLTILGEARNFINGQLVPPEWRNIYNVRWGADLVVSPGAVNTTKIRLQEQPLIDVSELLVNYLEPNNALVAYLTSSLTASSIPSQQINSLYNRLRSEYVIQSSAPFFSSSMVGGAFFTTINDRQYLAEIKDVLNSTQVTVYPPYTSAFSDGYSPFTQAGFSASWYQKNSFTPTLLTRSYADIELSKLTTYSGDAARVKIFVRSVDSPSSYQLIDDIRLEPQTLLTTASLNTGQQIIEIGEFANEGITYSGQEGITSGSAIPSGALNSYWYGGQVTSTGYTPNPATTPLILANDRQIDSVRLSPAATPIYLTHRQPFSIVGSSEYTIYFDAFAYSNAQTNTKLQIWLSGSAFPHSSSYGQFIGELTSDSVKRRWNDHFINFYANNDGTGQLVFVVSGSGSQWDIGDVYIKSAQESGFNPDTARIIAPIFGRRYERLQFKAELYDTNNNLVPVLIESEPVYFDGGNVVLKGTDHKLQGTLEILPTDRSVASIKLTTTGFTDPPVMTKVGQIQKDGSAIYIGYDPIPNVFTARTPFVVAADTGGLARIALGDKLLGYTEPSTGEFILIISGNIISPNFPGPGYGGSGGTGGAGTAGGGRTSDVYFDRVRGGMADFYDNRGRFAVTSGEWNDQIARMGYYTRGSTGYLAQTPLALPSISQSYNALLTGSVRVATSGSITVPADMQIANGTLYADMTILMEERALPTNTYFDLSYTVTAQSNWAGYPTSGSQQLQRLVTNGSVMVQRSGSYAPDQIIKYAIPIPFPRVGNTLYFVASVDVKTFNVIQV
jgi:hypothetical protein